MALSLFFVEIAARQGEWSATRIPGVFPGRYDLLTDTRFRELPGDHASFFAVLTADEAFNIVHRHRHRVTTMPHAPAAGVDPEQISADWDQVRRRANFILANLYEWDSGLDS